MMRPQNKVILGHKCLDCVLGRSYQMTGCDDNLEEQEQGKMYYIQISE